MALNTSIQLAGINPCLSPGRHLLLRLPAANDPHIHRRCGHWQEGKMREPGIGFAAADDETMLAGTEPENAVLFCAVPDRAHTIDRKTMRDWHFPNHAG